VATPLLSLKFQSYDLAILLLPVFLIAHPYLARDAALAPLRMPLAYLAVLLFGGLLLAERVPAETAFQFSVWLLLAVLAVLALASRRVAVGGA
jgi:hypothetical protein